MQSVVHIPVSPGGKPDGKQKNKQKT